MVMASTVQASSYPAAPPPMTASSHLDDTTNNNASSPTTMANVSATSASVTPPSPSFDPLRLQSASTHEALLRLHDNEIVLLESVKKFASLKSNCDKEYAKKLLEVCGQVRKSICSLESNNNNQPCSLPFLNAWNAFLRETERAAEMTRANADVISNKLVETFGAIVGEKKFTRKKYVDAKSSLESEVEKAVSLVAQQHVEYVKHVAKNKVAREKFEELFRKNKTGSAKFADAKGKFRKSSTRLHTIHNNYILALEDAKWWRLHRRQRLAPALLHHHHAGQVNLATQTKESLSQLRDLGDSAAEAFVEGQRRVIEEIDKVDAEDAYVGFGLKHMVLGGGGGGGGDGGTDAGAATPSDSDAPPLLFDNALLRDYQGTLAEGRIVVDDLTIDDLRIKLKYFVDRQRHFAAQIEKKRATIASLEAALSERQRGSTSTAGSGCGGGVAASSSTADASTILSRCNDDVDGVAGGDDNEEEETVGAPMDWQRSRRPTASSLENLLRESNKSLSSSDNVDAASDALNGGVNKKPDSSPFDVTSGGGDSSPSCNDQRQLQPRQHSSQQQQQKLQQPRGSVSSASLRPLSGASLILEGNNDAATESAESGFATDSSRNASLRKAGLSASNISQPHDQSPSPHKQHQHHQRQHSASIASPITSDTLTPNSPSKKSTVSASGSSSASSFSNGGGSPGSRGVTSDGAFVISNSLVSAAGVDGLLVNGGGGSGAITDQPPVHRGKGGESEIHLGVIRHLRQELEKLLCDKERCEAKLELVKSALETVKGEDGDADRVPNAILSDEEVGDAGAGGNNGANNAATVTARSPFKKNHKNRLTKIFKKGATDPAPPPPPDYPGNEDGAAGTGSGVNSDIGSNHVTTGVGGSGAGASGSGSAAPASAFPPSDRRASEEPPHSPPPALVGGGGLPRQMESYSDVEAAAGANHRLNRGRTGSLTPSMTHTFSSDGSGSGHLPPGTGYNPLKPVGELDHPASATSSSSNVNGGSGSATPQSPASSAPSALFSAGRRNSRTHSITLDSASLEEEEWFHGILPRDEVIRLLTENGDFLVRETTKNGKKNIVLSVAWNGHKHFMVQKTAEGKFRFEGSAFPSVPELIRSQWESGSPVTVKSGAVLQRQIPRMDWEIRNDDIVLRERIGNGNFGEVYKGILNTTGQDVAIKTCKINLPEDQKKKFLQEGSILKQYNHPNIVKLIGIAAQRQPIMIVMELVDGGSLLSFLRKHGGKSSAKMLVGLCADAAAGMEYLESVKCIHRDLAARNCLVGNVPGPNGSAVGPDKIVKISDFGMSRENEIYECSDGMKQIPIKWTAPEALNWGRYTSLCDVWSFGILMWEIFSHGSTPYPGWPNPRAREEVERGYRMPAPEGTPDKMYGLMRRCWEYEQENRPHFGELHAEIRAIHETIANAGP